MHTNKHLLQLDKLTHFIFIGVILMTVIGLLVSSTVNFYTRDDGLRNRTLGFVNNISQFILNQELKPIEHALNELAKIAELEPISPFSDEKIRSRVSTVAHVVPGIHLVGYGNIDGVTDLLPPKVDSHSIDARIRPWFHPNNTRSVFQHYTDLYLNSSSERLSLSVYQSVPDKDGRFSGSLFMDLDLEELSTSFRSLQLPIYGALSIIDRQGLTLIAGDKSQLTKPSISSNIVAKMVNTSGIIEDQRKIYFYHSYVHPDWFTVYSVDKEDYRQIIYDEMMPSFITKMIILSLLFIMWGICHIVLKQQLTNIYMLLKVGQTSHSLNLWDELSQQHSLLQDMTDKANKDRLTGLWNRGRYDADIHNLLANEESFTLALVDVDHFKQINDTFGHSAGDDVLKAISQLGITTLDGEATLYRYGGEELAVIFRHRNESESKHFLDRWRQTLEDKVWLEPNLKVTFSAGVARYSPKTEGDSVQERADKYLYKAKKQGRNQVLTSDDYH